MSLGCEFQIAYKNSNGLSTRISIHDKYSGLHNWYFTVMKMEDGMRVLELGAGSAVHIWRAERGTIKRRGVKNGW